MKKLLVRPLANHQATDQVAQKIYDEFLFSEDRFVVFLEGGLGVGKTYLVRKLLEAFGVQEEITSPTYALVNEYEVTESPSDQAAKFAHFDFYRLEEPDDFFARGFQDIADDGQVSCFVEWPEKISEEARKSFSGKMFVLKMEHGIGVGMRKVTLLEKA